MFGKFNRNGEQAAQDGQFIIIPHDKGMLVQSAVGTYIGAMIA